MLNDGNLRKRGNVSSWHSYPKIYNVGHGAVRDLMNGPVSIEEKIDGSQFSFGKFNGVLQFRSKGVQIYADSVEGMFVHAVKTVQELAPLLTDGYTYRAEYLQKPKHNTLAYSRLPSKHLIIFDINDAEESYLDYDTKKSEAERIGLEVVPQLAVGTNLRLEDLQALLQRDSVLGGQKIEGFVIKQASKDLKFGADKKALMAKYVSEAFKELHSGDWKERNPLQNDIIVILTNTLRTPARWEKAVQHLRERGELTNSPKDIGNLMKEVVNDTFAEELAMIQDKLSEWALPKIQRGIVGGLAQWYKDRLLASQFEGGNDGRN